MGKGEMGSREAYSPLPGSGSAGVPGLLALLHTVRGREGDCHLQRRHRVQLLRVWPGAAGRLPAASSEPSVN